ncbi:MAG TPA: tetratricopeptide repeat protein [Nitrospirales bacterium]|jgi:lipopolysaccharide biosynthesis regulator YciM|nr:tetratricopeptide repeat protein [Nitrospirales bacterium]
MRFFLWVLTLIAAIVAAVNFSDLNPDPITIRLPFVKQSSVAVTPIYLVLSCIAAGALAVVMLVGVREMRALILNWRSTQRRKRDDKIQSYYTDGLLASLSRRTSEAISLLQKALMLDPNHTRALLSLGKIFRREKNYNEAIRLHRKARFLEEGNLEILFSLARDLEDAKRFDEAIQALNDVLKLDGTNPTALYRIRDIHIRNGKWPDAHAVQERLLKAGLPEPEVRAETQVMAGLKYEVGRHYMERGNRDQARRYFKDAIKLDKGFLPARIGFGELLIREGKLKEAADSWEKTYLKNGNALFLQRLEDLYLEMGEPGEMLRIYQDSLARRNNDPALKLALGKLYYRLEMIDDALDLLSTLEGIQDPTGDFQKIMTSLHIRKGDTETALMELQETLGKPRAGAALFFCTTCQYETREWSGRCPACGRWNTLALTAPTIGSGSPSKPSPGVTAPFEIF